MRERERLKERRKGMTEALKEKLKEAFQAVNIISQYRLFFNYLCLFLLLTPKIPHDALW